MPACYPVRDLMRYLEHMEIIISVDAEAASKRASTLVARIIQRKPDVCADGEREIREAGRIDLQNQPAWQM